MPHGEDSSAPRMAGHFPSTHWSAIFTAGHAPTPQARHALSGLCSAYWYPLYAYLRRRGRSKDDAEDLTQGFLSRLLEKNALEVVDQSKGKFRSFLLASLNHFAANEWDRARAEKRGGNQTVLSIDGASAEARYALEPSHGASPEKVYERDWALTLLEQVLARLREEHVVSNRTDLFERLKSSLSGPTEGYYAQVAAELGMSEGAVKVAAHRMRQRYRELLRLEIAQTVARPEDIDDEIRALFAALS